jgi:hypothetical protein
MKLLELDLLTINHNCEYITSIWDKPGTGPHVLEGPIAIYGNVKVKIKGSENMNNLLEQPIVFYDTEVGYLCEINPETGEGKAVFNGKMLGRLKRKAKTLEERA